MRPPFFDPNWLTTLHAATPAIIAYTRAAVGWGSISLGVLGSILPIIPGLPFLLIGIHLVGHRNRKLRWARVHSKLLLRHCVRSEALWIHRPARLVRLKYAQTRQYVRSWQRRTGKKPPVNSPEA